MINILEPFTPISLRAEAERNMSVFVQSTTEELYTKNINLPGYPRFLFLSFSSFEQHF